MSKLTQREAQTLNALRSLRGPVPASAVIEKLGYKDFAKGYWVHRALTTLARLGLVTVTEGKLNGGVGRAPYLYAIRED